MRNVVGRFIGSSSLIGRCRLRSALSTHVVPGNPAGSGCMPFVITLEKSAASNVLHQACSVNVTPMVVR